MAVMTVSVRRTASSISRGGALPRRANSVAEVERELAERIGVEESAYIVAISGLQPLDRGEFEEAMRGPVREQTEDVAVVGPRLDFVKTTAREQRRESCVHDAALVPADKSPVPAPHGLPAHPAPPHVVLTAFAPPIDEAAHPH